MKNKISNLIESLQENIYCIGANKFILYILLVLFSSIPAIFSYSEQNNFWEIMLNIVTYNFHILTLLAICFFGIIKINDYYKSSMFALRSENYNEFLKTILKKIYIFIGFIFIVNLLFCIVIVIARTNFNFEFINYQIYDIPLAIYLIIYLVREIIIIFFVETIMFYLYNLTNKIISYSIMAFIFIFGIIHNHTIVINSIWNLPLLFTDYLTSISYSNIFFELSGSIIQIILFMIVTLIVEYFASIKRRDFE